MSGPSYAVGQPSIDNFLDAIWAERGLSRNTLSSYRYDLQNLARSLKKKHGVAIESATRDQILGFLADEVRQGRNSRSLSRYLSGFRQYYQWLVRERRIDDDPTALIESPKLGRGLPKISPKKILAFPGPIDNQRVRYHLDWRWLPNSSLNKTANLKFPVIGRFHDRVFG